MRVLVVEDDPGVREALRMCLDDTGHRVEEAANGREALDRLASDPLPDIVLLDLMMPVLDGYGFLEARRSDPRLADLPVLVLTACGATRAAELDIAGWLDKPFAVDVLLDMMDQAVAA